MNAKQVIKHYGSTRKAAEAIGVTYNAVQNWKSAGVPRSMQFELEVITGGKLKADRSPRSK